MLVPLTAALAPRTTAPRTAVPFAIHVVDAQTGRGVPLVELRTVSGLRFVTDSAGFVAFDEPALEKREVYVHVRSHGYEFPADGFGYRGVVLRPRAGGEATIRLPRRNVAERLVRLTGEGIYRDTIRLRRRVPLISPLLNAGVTGQDTAQAIVYRGRELWFWGDTNRAGYPLGNFHTTGAVATIARAGIEGGIDYAYFGDGRGFVREMLPMKEPGPVWMSGLAVVGARKDERLYAGYARMVRLGEVAERGIARWNDLTERFEVAQRFDAVREWRYLDGHLLRHEGYLQGNATPNVRVRADARSLLDPAAYEALTPLDAEGRVVRRDGMPDYRWQRALPPIDSAGEARLVASGALKPEETRFLPVDPDGKPVEIAGGNVAWSAHRRRWIGIFGRKAGRTSFLGEIDYAEADAPTGPFRRAVPIVEHDRTTFYNPVHHAFLDRDDAIFFEGTYT
ncbi:hypothetical protein EON77_03010, partial [bacterium]